MRIISGKFKGRQLKFVSDETTRPTADIVRQAFFTKIQFDIVGSVFLDLFSGSGGIGIEALSREAKEVCFIEKSKRNYEIIKSNIISLYGKDYQNESVKQGQTIQLINVDFSIFLNSENKKTFDFVYIDPPFESRLYEIALKLLKDNNLLTNESMVICEWNKKDKKPFSAEGYQIISEKKYGTKMLTYLKLTH